MTCSICRREWNGGHFPQECRAEVVKQRDAAEAALKEANERLAQQPVEEVDGVLRFQRNRIVCFLLDAGPFDMNMLALMAFSDEDRAQFAQLIGYSVDGWHELSYVQRLTQKE